MIDEFKTNGSSPPVRYRCGTTLGAMCWAGSLLARQRTYHAPCADAADHLGACICAVCCTMIAIRARGSVTTRHTETRDEELPRYDRAKRLLILVALVVVAGANAEVLSVAVLTGAGWLRWVLRSEP